MDERQETLGKEIVYQLARQAKASEDMEFEIANAISILDSFVENNAESKKQVIDYLLCKLTGGKNPDEEVYCGDIVSLTIDGETYQYFISSNLNSNFGIYNEILWCSDLAIHLIGSYVGDTINYQDKYGNIHIVKIIKTTRTYRSEKIDIPFELGLLDSDRYVRERKFAKEIVR